MNHFFGAVFEAAFGVVVEVLTTTGERFRPDTDAEQSDDEEGGERTNGRHLRWCLDEVCNAGVKHIATERREGDYIDVDTNCPSLHSLVVYKQSIAAIQAIKVGSWRLVGMIQSNLSK